MPSAALTQWQNDRMTRLNEVDAHCAAVLGLLPPNPKFLDETLRGFVLHLSAHFQGFCRDLYSECSQIWIAAIPVGDARRSRLAGASGLQTIRIQQFRKAISNLAMNRQRQLVLLHQRKQLPLRD